MNHRNSLRLSCAVTAFGVFAIMTACTPEMAAEQLIEEEKAIETERVRTAQAALGTMQPSETPRLARTPLPPSAPKEVSQVFDLLPGWIWQSEGDFIWYLLFVLSDAQGDMLICGSDQVSSDPTLDIQEITAKLYYNANTQQWELSGEVRVPWLYNPSPNNDVVFLLKLSSGQGEWTLDHSMFTGPTEGGSFGQLEDGTLIGFDAAGPLTSRDEVVAQAKQFIDGLSASSQHQAGGQDQVTCDEA